MKLASLAAAQVSAATSIGETTCRAVSATSVKSIACLPGGIRGTPRWAKRGMGRMGTGYPVAAIRSSGEGSGVGGTSGCSNKLRMRTPSASRIRLARSTVML